MVEPMTPGRARGTAAVMAVAILWIGMLLGVSFLATPVKFMAPSLTLPVALDVGRHTFAVFNKAEWLLSLLLLLAVFAGGRTRLNVAAVVVVIVLVAAETFWLLPPLDQRVGAIIAGQQPAPSNLHELYIGLEVAKLFVLILVAFVTAKHLTAFKSSP